MHIYNQYNKCKLVTSFKKFFLIENFPDSSVTIFWSVDILCLNVGIFFETVARRRFMGMFRAWIGSSL